MQSTSERAAVQEVALIRKGEMEPLWSDNQVSLNKEATVPSKQSFAETFQERSAFRSTHLIWNLLVSRRVKGTEVHGVLQRRNDFSSNDLGTWSSQVWVDAAPPTPEVFHNNYSMLAMVTELTIIKKITQKLVTRVRSNIGRAICLDDVLTAKKDERCFGSMRKCLSTDHDAISVPSKKWHSKL